MLALPPDIPAFNGDGAVEVYQCTQQASKYYNVNPFVLQTILKVEGGRVGIVRRNKNRTKDYGVMQVNDVWVDEIAKKQKIKIDTKSLTYNACYNIHIGTWILATKIKEANGDVWKGVGNYHSKTSKYHMVYLRKAVKAYLEIYQHWYSVYKDAGKI